MRVTERIDAIEYRFHEFQTHYGQAVMSGRVDTKRVSKLLESIESTQTAMMDLVKAQPAWHPTAVERIDSLVAGVERLAREKGAGMYLGDALHSLVMERLTGDIQAYWHRAGHHSLFGMIRNQPEVAELLRDRGILVWTNADDRHVRLVNTQWLVTHADIRAHVAKEWEGGRRCRLCRITEIATSRELSPVDPARRGHYTMQSGQHVMQPGVIYAHEQCIQTWKQWLAIAESYKTQAEAEAADIAAGRTAQPATALPDLKSEKPRGDEPQHFNSQEQSA